MFLDIDVRAVLPTIHVPTLVLHRRGDRVVNRRAGRELASRIPGAQYVELPGIDHLPWAGDADAVLGEIEEFLTGSRTPRASSQLATNLFTDVVGSTELAARLHHERWQRLLQEHDELVRREIELAGGVPVKAVGDGFLATFQAPAGAIRAAEEAIRATAPLGLQLRAGIHVGTVEPVGDDVRGMAVNIAARIRELASPGQILVSATVRDILIDSSITLVPTSTARLRGVPGEWTLYEHPVGGSDDLAPARPDELAARRAAGGSSRR
jgi:class 3 adenylate cyclase